MLSQVRYLPSQVCEVMTLPSVLAERPTMMLVQLCCQPSISSEVSWVDDIPETADGSWANADRVYRRVVVRIRVKMRFILVGSCYVKTMFFRFLLSLKVITQNISKDSFSFVPLQDFSHPWTDEMLYEKYGLDENEISFIESMIRPME